MRYKFIGEHKNEYAPPNVVSSYNVEISCEVDDDLDSVLELFHRFLLGCGFEPEGKLQYVEEDASCYTICHKCGIKVEMQQGKAVYKTDKGFFCHQCGGDK